MAKTFRKGVDLVWYAPHAKDAYGSREIAAVTKALQNGWLTTGPITALFEKRIAGIFGKKHGLFVNSGSSANLLALEALNFPKGSEIITPALNFNTTVAPIVQCGLVPVFVDVKEGYYTLDAGQLPKALSKETRAIMIPHLIGNLYDISKVHAFAKKHGLVVIEDSCDTIGARYKGKPTGASSAITTTSFYASHLVTTAGAGGMVMFHDQKLRERTRVFRDWGRGISKHDDQIRSRLSTFSIGGAPYDSAFAFVERGYNMRPTEVQAAFGLAQLERLPSFAKARKKNYAALRKFLARFPEHFILPEVEKGAETNWLAFPITLKKGSPLDRNTFVTYLEDRKIQTRPLFSGNITKHPAYKGIGRAVGKLPVADHILGNAFVVGVHHGITPSMRSHMEETIESFVRKYA